MALDKNLDGNNEIAQFLEKFTEQPFPAQPDSSIEPAPSVRPTQYARSFEKLEQKIHELEEKFEASTTQNQQILNELAHTREMMENQKDKDAFLEHLSRTIATLRTSVENLSHSQEKNSFVFREAPVQRSFDPLPTVFAPTHTQTEPAFPAADAYSQLQQERDEQTRRFNSLRQKASQLKAVNSALDREIKKAQQERLDALKKSADQAKEILSLRDQLTAAEERFKSFDFEGRIISIKQEYQQKVTNLETRLKEMSDTCVKQVEEIESLKAENTKLQHATVEKEALQAALLDKEQELASLKETISSLQAQQAGQHTKQLTAFTSQLRTLEEQRDRLAVELEQSQISLENIRREKELLEKNFKELVSKINQNDEVIEQLKQKIDVLGQQNTQLAQHNEELSNTNKDLLQEKEALTQTNTQLTKANQNLTQAKASLEQSNEQLTQHNASLVQQKENLTKQLQQQAEQPAVSAPTQDVEAPSKERSNAALLAARFMQNHLSKKNVPSTQIQGGSTLVSPTAQQVLEDALRKPASPVVRSLGKRISTAQDEEEWEFISTKAVIPNEQHDRDESSSKSTELPEIKVADPIDQPDLLEGEDFLEKTDSFIGRMKWSIFHEDR